MRPIRIALVAAVLVPFSMLSAQQPAPAAMHHAAVVTTDVVYGHKAGMALTFDVYRPRTPNGAAVISVLSAGWRSGWDSLQQFQEQPDGSVRMMTAAAIAAAPGVLPSHSYIGLLDKGFTVFAVRHGSSPTFGMADIVADMRRAVRVIKRKAPMYGVDPDRIGLWGGSAGGHLSLLLGTSAEIANANTKDEVEQGPAKFAAIVAYAPPTDLVTQWAHWTQNGPQQFAAVNMSDADRRTVVNQRAKLESMLGPGPAGAGEPRMPAAMSDEDLVNALAQYLDLEPLEKQSLLEQPCLRTRAESLVELLEMKILMAKTPRGSTFAH